jgi:hypothetical protein
MKIALIEDRIPRLEKYVDFELKKYLSLEIITGLAFSNLVVSLDRNDTKILDEFNCISCHRSAISNEIRDVLKEYCRINKKPLIFFSGGITSSVLKDLEFPFLHINSKDFYSQNLKLFIESSEDNNTVNLLILQFGAKWKLTLLLNLRNRIIVAQNKLAIKEQFPNAEIDEIELIKRVRDLQISSVIMEDLYHSESEHFFLKNDLNLISSEQVQSLKTFIDRLISDMI